MHLRSLSLQGFRLYERSDFNFSAGINVIHGGNARGKTSLLEAIHFLMTGRSFRTIHSSDMIRQGKQAFFLEASFVKHGIEQGLKVAFNEKERRIIYNTTAYPSLSILLGILQGVIVHPDDAGLVKGAPMVRRHFLDLQIAQADPLYIHCLTRYHRAMRQRNHLLRAKNPATIDSWEHEMAHAAAYVVSQRRRAVEDLEKGGRQLYLQISGESALLTLHYKTTAPHQEKMDALQSYYLDQFKKHRRREMELGMTLTGPHKDDLMVSLGDREVRFFASEGQQRSCVAALRLAEWERLKSMTGETPLMLLDDISISLDRSRREKLFKHLATLDQVFLTATHPIQQEEFGCQLTYTSI